MDVRKKIITISAFSLIVFILLILFGVWPLLGSIKKSSQELIDMKKSFSLSEKREESLEGVSKRYEELEPNLKKIDGLFIDKSAPVELIKFWEKTAGDLGIKIDISAASSEKNTGESWDFLAFQVRLDGPFVQCLKFIEKNENSPYLLLIKGLDIRSSGSVGVSSGSGSYSAEDDVSVILTVNAFSR